MELVGTQSNVNSFKLWKLDTRFIKSEQKLAHYSKGLKELAQSFFSKSKLFFLGPTAGAGPAEQARLWSTAPARSPGGAVGAWSEICSPYSYSKTKTRYEMSLHATAPAASPASPGHEDDISINSLLGAVFNTGTDQCLVLLAVNTERRT